MKIIDREMESKVITTEKGEASLYCQASFNSQGNITLRNYDVNNKNSDEIIILSAEETQAIIELFYRISTMMKHPLPF